MQHYGLIGQHLSHSYSPQYMSLLFEQMGIEASYETHELQDIAMIRGLIEREHIDGLNVTMPFKQTVIPYLDQIDTEAEAIGAVNCIKVQWLKVQSSRFNHSPHADAGQHLPLSKSLDFHLVGYNTDIVGIRRTLLPLCSKTDKALILGTGGIAKTVAYALTKAGIAYSLVSRNPHAVASLDFFSYDQLNKNIIDTHNIIINCTPIGMYPNVDEYPLLPYQYLTNKHLLYDAIYNPERTLFLRLGAKQGAKTLNGLALLHEQANAAALIFTDCSSTE